MKKKTPVVKSKGGLVLAKGDEKAPKGKVFVCLGCGKISTTRFGLGAKNGWDESCMLNCILADKNKLVFGEYGRVTKIEE